jgi:hypothetical protein
MRQTADRRRAKAAGQESRCQPPAAGRQPAARPRALLPAAAISVAAPLLLLAGVALAADLLTVVQKETAVRKEKRLLSGKVATVREGDQVVKLEQDGSWYRVSYQGAEGWLPVSAVSSDRKVVLSSEAIGSGVRATEQSAGARGFNPEVEARHRSSRSDLATAYRLVDRIQERKFPEERIAAFVREGKLGEALAEREAEPPEARPVPPWKQAGGRR